MKLLVNTHDVFIIFGTEINPFSRTIKSRLIQSLRRAPIVAQTVWRCSYEPSGGAILRPMKFLSFDSPFLTKVALAAAALVLAATHLAGCGSISDEVSGTAFSMPEHVATATFDANAAETSGTCAIDTSSVASGYVGASAQASSRLKFLIACGDATMIYDLPQDGTPIVCPLSLGDGPYSFRIMQNTSGENYVELFSAQASVELSSEFELFLRPNIYCDFDDASASTAQARKLAKKAKRRPRPSRTFATGS